MARDEDKARLYRLILQEISKFDDPENEQRLSLIEKKLGLPSKQALNYYLRRFLDKKLIKKTKSFPYAIYELTNLGERVKENLVQSERGVKTVTWKLHNIIVSFKIETWGSWRFNEKKIKKMNNWFYQEIRIASGYVANVQSTGLLKIYVPKKYGPDPEIMAGQAYSEACEAARWIGERFAFTMGPMKVVRKGEKELMGSQDLAKLFGRVKTEDFYINASTGEENLEEPEDSFHIENILGNIEQTPIRLEKIESALEKLAPTIADLSYNMKTHIIVMQNINRGITELRNAVKELKADTRDTYPSQGADNGLKVNSGPRFDRNIEKSGLEAYSETTMLQIEIVKKMPGFKFTEEGAEKRVRSLGPGSRIWLPEFVARDLIKNGYAQEVADG